MRKQTDEDLRIIHNEKDMLNGNINRMCVTDDWRELLEMRDFAIRRIKHIYQVNYERLTGKELNDEFNHS